MNKTNQTPNKTKIENKFFFSATTLYSHSRGTQTFHSLLAIAQPSILHRHHSNHNHHEQSLPLSLQELMSVGGG